MSCEDIIVEESNETTVVTSSQEEIVAQEDNAITEIISSQDEYIVVNQVRDTIVVDSCDVNLIVTPIGSDYESFTPTQGQTIFTLANSLSGNQVNLSKVFINGQKISHPSCYTISGTQLTVILPYSLTPNDILEIYY